MRMPSDIQSGVKSEVVIGLPMQPQSEIAITCVNTELRE